MVWVQIEYPEIEEGTKPRHRFMSSYEQVTCPDHKIVIYIHLLDMTWLHNIIMQCEFVHVGPKSITMGCRS